jgi:hypothetical protein
MFNEEVVFQGIPLWLLREYLEELGGEAVGDDRVVADGWTADIAKIEPFRIGSLVIGRVKMVLQGDPDAIAQMRPGLEQKTIRSGA